MRLDDIECICGIIINSQFLCRVMALHRENLYKILRHLSLLPWSSDQPCLSGQNLKKDRSAFDDGPAG
jgi:hypothetical protein